jgi:geranylgeranyl diphosphate synthase type I
MQNTSLKEKLIEISNAVEPVIKDLLVQDVEKNNADVVYYQCGVGGKRLRPALVVLSGQVFGGDMEGLLYPAASVEILHNSTLIIDDIIDHSDFRRDKPTTWKKYGPSIAQCTAFDYLAAVFAGLNRVNNSEKLIDLYSKTLKVIIDGEIKDILFERSGRGDEAFVVENRYKVITKDDYFKMISQKTAVLLQASCKAGAIYANASDNEVEQMGEFGYNLGIAFQVRDDILDIFADEKEFGKKVGKDIIEKKMGNYVILSAVEQLGPEDEAVINELLSNPKEITDEDIKIVTELIAKTDARQEAERTADYYIQKALAALDRLPKNEYSEKLAELAKYIVDRSK